MYHKLLLSICVLLSIACQYALSAVTTVRPYKFGFTIDEQQHRAEQRDERGIVMGEFGFITADGIYHVTVYATDEEGKFRILSMRSYPYAGPVMAKTITTTQPAPAAPAAPAKNNFYSEGCAGCFLNKSAPKGSTKTEIRPLSQSLSTAENPLPAESRHKAVITGHVNSNLLHTSNKHNTHLSYDVGFIDETHQKAKLLNPKKLHNMIAVHATQIAQPKLNAVAAKPKVFTVTKTVSLPLKTVSQFKTSKQTNTPKTLGQRTQPIHAHTQYTTQHSQERLTTVTATGKTGNAAQSGAPKTNTVTANAAVAANKARTTTNKSPAVSTTPTLGNAKVPGLSNSPRPQAGAGKVSDIGDLYHFKYVLDYNGHEETGGRNGNKEGNYFAIGSDDVARTIEYVANEFGFQPHVSWRKLSADEAAQLPTENTLKHNEFTWFTDKN